MQSGRMKGSSKSGGAAPLLIAVGVSLSFAPALVAEPAAAIPEKQTEHELAGAFADLAQWVGGKGGRLSAEVRSASGEVWASHHEHAALNPASNMKVVTAAVVLDELGPGYRFTTGLYGHVRGNAIERLVLRGHGDPSLTTADLWRLAQSIARRGVRYVGHVIVDQSWFDNAFVPPAFEQQPDEWASFRAPVSAIALDRNAVTLNVIAAAPDEPARVWFEPNGFVRIAGEVQTRAAGAGQGVRLDLKPDGERLLARLSGHVATGVPRLRFKRRVADPRWFPGYVLAQLLREAGVDVTGSVQQGRRDVLPRLTYVESAPISVLVQGLGKRSDNFYAEMLLKALGAEARGAPGRSESGAAVAGEWLARLGAEKDNRIRNGSGLFDANRLTAAALVRVIQHAVQSPRFGPEFLSQLSIGGTDGTLRSRFREHKKTRSIRAKTGTLDEAIALSGLVLGPNRSNDVAFSFLVEGIRGQHAEIRARIDRCVDAIADELAAAKH